MTASPTIPDPATIIAQTRCWLESVIIELNFCPFAKREFVKNSIRYTVSEQTDLAMALEVVADECQQLDQHPQTETTLLMFSRGFSAFDDFLQLIEMADQLIDQLGYRATYQLAHFHPDYCFAGSNNDDAANYTNRSPWPTLHLLREASLQRAIDAYPDTAQIPENNIRRARELGKPALQARLQQCLAAQGKKS
ncbi:MAG TPA: DUF1415 domain-containing protein [Gammaproteobacteria bacterium]